jgi:hypothetical protein
MRSLLVLPIGCKLYVYFVNQFDRDIAKTLPVSSSPRLPVVGGGVEIEKIPVFLNSCFRVSDYLFYSLRIYGFKKKGHNCPF